MPSRAEVIERAGAEVEAQRAKFLGASERFLFSRHTFLSAPVLSRQVSIEKWRRDRAQDQHQRLVESHGLELDLYGTDDEFVGVMEGKMGEDEISIAEYKEVHGHTTVESDIAGLRNGDEMPKEEATEIYRRYFTTISMRNTAEKKWFYLRVFRPDSNPKRTFQEMTAPKKLPFSLA